MQWSQRIIVFAVATLGLGVGVIPSEAHAQEIPCAVVALAFGFGMIPSEAQAQEMPCSEEIQKFCASVEPGGGRILQCLIANESKLSSACMQRMHDFQDAVSGPMGACRDDWVALCYHPRASTERQAMTDCLRAHEKKVSAGCRKALQGTGDMQRQRSKGMMP